MIQPLWRTVWRFLKKLKIELPCDPAIPLWGIYPEKTIIEKDTCRDFPGGTVVKTPCSQCREPGVQYLVRELDPTGMPQLRSPCATTKESMSHN